MELSSQHSLHLILIIQSVLFTLNVASIASDSNWKVCMRIKWTKRKNERYENSAWDWNVKSNTQTKWRCDCKVGVSIRTRWKTLVLVYIEYVNRVVGIRDVGNEGEIQYGIKYDVWKLTTTYSVANTQIYRHALTHWCIQKFNVFFPYKLAHARQRKKIAYCLR